MTERADDASPRTGYLDAATELREDGLRAVETGDYERAIELLRGIAADVDPVADLTVYMQLARSLGIIGRVDESCAVLRDALVRAESNPFVAASIAVYLSASLCDAGHHVEARQRLDRIDVPADPFGEARLVWAWARLATFEDDLEVAADRMRDGLAIFERMDDALTVARGRTMLAEVLNMSGQPAAALEELEPALSVIEELGANQDVIAARADHAFALARTGDPEGARRVAGPALSIVARGDTLGEAKLRWALTEAAVAKRESLVALAELSATVRLWSIERRYHRALLDTTRRALAVA